MTRGPEYQVWRFELETAPPGGFVRLEIAAGKFWFADARDATGALRADALLEIAWGEADDDYFPIKLGTVVTNRGGQKARVRWTVQAGVSAYLVIGDPALVEFQSPATASIVQGEQGSTIASTAVAAATTTTLLVAASGSRFAIEVANAGAVPVFIGGAGVTVAAGFPLDPGQRWRSTSFRGALYGIVAAGTADMRVIEETA